jgi:hypothetical protein
LRDFAVPVGVPKTGWWRLTFVVDPLAEYTITSEEPHRQTQMFSVPSNVVLNNIHPFDTSAFTPVRAEEGVKYEPQLDTVNNLTYIDIFITDRRQGGMGMGG